MDGDIFFRRRRCIVNKIISTLLIFTFIVTNTTYANPSYATGVSTQDFAGTTSISNIQLPESLGEVDELYLPSGSAVSIDDQDRFIAFIQAAHANVEAQGNIEAIIQNLNQSFGKTLVALEGASGKLATNNLKVFDDANLNRALVNNLFENGDLTGAEKYATTNPKNASFVGVDDPELYRANLEAYRKTYRLRDASVGWLSTILGNLKKLKDRIFSKELKKFDKSREAFYREQLSTYDYLSFLSAWALSKGVVDLNDPMEQKDFPILTRILALKRTAAKMDGYEQQLMEEIDDIVKRFEQEGVGREFVAPLKNLPESLPRGGSRAYFEELFMRSLNFNQPIVWSEYSAFRVFTEYSILQEEIDGVRFFREIRSLEDLILNDLALGKREKEVLQISQDAVVLDRLFRLEASKEEVAYFKNRKSLLTPFMMEARVDEITSQFSGFKASVTKVDLKEVEAALLNAERFYRLAAKRDSVLLQNTLKWMKQENLSKAIMVSGGFHSQGIRRLMRDRKIPYYLISPKITKDFGTEKYEKLLMGDEFKNVSRGSKFQKLEAVLALTPIKEIKIMDPNGIRRLATSVVREGLQTLAKGLPKPIDPDQFAKAAAEINMSPLVAATEGLVELFTGMYGATYVKLGDLYFQYAMTNLRSGNLAVRELPEDKAARLFAEAKKRAGIIDVSEKAKEPELVGVSLGEISEEQVEAAVKDENDEYLKRYFEQAGSQAVRQKIDELFGRERWYLSGVVALGALRAGVEGVDYSDVDRVLEKMMDSNDLNGVKFVKYVKSFRSKSEGASLGAEKIAEQLKQIRRIIEELKSAQAVIQTEVRELENDLDRLEYATSPEGDRIKFEIDEKNNLLGGLDVKMEEAQTIESGLLSGKVFPGNIPRLMSHPSEKYLDVVMDSYAAVISRDENRQSVPTTSEVFKVVDLAGFDERLAYQIADIAADAADNTRITIINLDDPDAQPVIVQEDVVPLMEFEVLIGTKISVVVEGSDDEQIMWAIADLFETTGFAENMTPSMSLGSQLEQARASIREVADIINMDEVLLAKIVEPEKVIHVKIPVRMDDGTTKVFDGFRSQHNSARGPYKGGFRMSDRHSVEDTRDEAIALSTWMSIKTGVVGIPLGGGKGDIVVDRFSLSENEQAQLTRGYIREILAKEGLGAIGPFSDIPAPDMNTDGTIMAWFLDEYLKIMVANGKIIDGRLEKHLKDFIERKKDWVDTETPVLDEYLRLASNESINGFTFDTFELATITGKPAGDAAVDSKNPVFVENPKNPYRGGSQARDKATGQGGFFTLKRVMEARGEKVPGTTVAIQGYGNVGGHGARIMDEAGMKVNAIQSAYRSDEVDADGKAVFKTFTIFNENGIDIHALNEWIAAETKRLGTSQFSLAAFPGAEEIADDDFWKLDVDVLVPAAKDNEITGKNADGIVAQYVLELANGPTDGEADKILNEKGVIVIPDVLANSGGVAVSYFEMVQNMTHDRWTTEKVDNALLERINHATDEILDVMNKKGISMRDAAYVLSLIKIADAEIARDAELAARFSDGTVKPYEIASGTRLPETYLELNKAVQDGTIAEIAQENLYQFDQVIQNIADEAAARFRKGSGRNKAILITGPAAVGKAAISQRVIEALKLKDRRLKVRYIDYDMNNERRMKKLLSGERTSIEMPTNGFYGPATAEDVTLQPGEILVVEGEDSFPISDFKNQKGKQFLGARDVYRVFVNTAPSLNMPSLTTKGGRIEFDSGGVPLTSFHLTFLREILDRKNRRGQKMTGEQVLKTLKGWHGLKDEQNRTVFGQWENADVTVNTYFPEEIPVIRTQLDGLLRDAIVAANNEFRAGDESARAWARQLKRRRLVLNAIAPLELDGTIIPEGHPILQWAKQPELGALSVKDLKNEKIAYVMLKPEVLGKTREEIINFLKSKGLQIAWQGDPRVLPMEKVQEFYVEHEGKAFYEGLTSYINSGEIVPLILRGDEQAFKYVRSAEVVGKTDGTDAGSLRNVFGVDPKEFAGFSMQMNKIHASDSFDSVIRESMLVLSPIELKEVFGVDGLAYISRNLLEKNKSLSVAEKNSIRTKIIEAMSLGVEEEVFERLNDIRSLIVSLESEQDMARDIVAQLASDGNLDELRQAKIALDEIDRKVKKAKEIEEKMLTGELVGVSLGEVTDEVLDDLDDLKGFEDIGESLTDEEIGEAIRRYKYWQDVIDTMLDAGLSPSDVLGGESLGQLVGRAVWVFGEDSSEFDGFGIKLFEALDIDSETLPTERPGLMMFPVNLAAHMLKTSDAYENVDGVVVFVQESARLFAEEQPIDSSQKSLTAIAAERGVPVVFVNPQTTSEELKESLASSLGVEMVRAELSRVNNRLIPVEEQINNLQLIAEGKAAGNSTVAAQVVEILEKEIAPLRERRTELIEWLRNFAPEDSQSLGVLTTVKKEPGFLFKTTVAVASIGLFGLISMMSLLTGQILLALTVSSLVVAIVYPEAASALSKIKVPVSNLFKKLFVFWVAAITAFQAKTATDSIFEATDSAEKDLSEGISWNTPSNYQDSNTVLSFFKPVRAKVGEKSHTAEFGGTKYSPVSQEGDPNNLYFVEKGTDDVVFSLPIDKYSSIESIFDEGDKIFVFVRKLDNKGGFQGLAYYVYDLATQTPSIDISREEWEMVGNLSNGKVLVTEGESVPGYDVYRFRHGSDDFHGYFMNSTTGALDFALPMSDNWKIDKVGLVADQVLIRLVQLGPYGTKSYRYHLYDSKNRKTYAEMSEELWTDIYTGATEEGEDEDEVPVIANVGNDATITVARDEFAKLNFPIAGPAKGEWRDLSPEEILAEYPDAVVVIRFAGFENAAGKSIKTSKLMYVPVKDLAGPDARQSFNLSFDAKVKKFLLKRGLVNVEIFMSIDVDARGRYKVKLGKGVEASDYERWVATVEMGERGLFDGLAGVISTPVAKPFRSRLTLNLDLSDLGDELDNVEFVAISTQWSKTKITLQDGTKITPQKPAKPKKQPGESRDAYRVRLDAYKKSLKPITHYLAIDPVKITDSSNVEVVLELKDTIMGAFGEDVELSENSPVVVDIDVNVVPGANGRDLGESLPKKVKAIKVKNPETGKKEVVNETVIDELTYIPRISAVPTGELTDFSGMGIGASLMDPNGVITFFEQRGQRIQVTTDFSKAADDASKWAGVMFYTGPLADVSGFENRFFNLNEEPNQTFTIQTTGFSAVDAEAPTEIKIAFSDDLVIDEDAEGGKTYRSVEVVVTDIQDGYYVSVPASVLTDFEPDFNVEAITSIVPLFSYTESQADTVTYNFAVKGTEYVAIVEPSDINPEDMEGLLGNPAVGYFYEAPASVLLDHTERGLVATFDNSTIGFSGFGFTYDNSNTETVETMDYAGQTEVQFEIQRLEGDLDQLKCETQDSDGNSYEAHLTNITTDSGKVWVVDLVEASEVIDLSKIVSFWFIPEGEGETGKFLINQKPAAADSGSLGIDRETAVEIGEDLADLDRFDAIVEATGMPVVKSSGDLFDLAKMEENGEFASALGEVSNFLSEQQVKFQKSWNDLNPDVKRIIARQLLGKALEQEVSDKSDASLGEMREVSQKVLVDVGDDNELQVIKAGMLVASMLSDIYDAEIYIIDSGKRYAIGNYPWVLARINNREVDVIARGLASQEALKQAAESFGNFLKNPNLALENLTLLIDSASDSSLGELAERQKIMARNLRILIMTESSEFGLEASVLAKALRKVVNGEKVENEKLTQAALTTLKFAHVTNESREIQNQILDGAVALLETDLSAQSLGLLIEQLRDVKALEVSLETLINDSERLRKDGAGFEVLKAKNAEFDDISRLLDHERDVLRARVAEAMEAIKEAKVGYQLSGKYVDNLWNWYQAAESERYNVVINGMSIQDRIINWAANPSKATETLVFFMSSLVPSKEEVWDVPVSAGKYEFVNIVRDMILEDQLKLLVSQRGELTQPEADALLAMDIDTYSNAIFQLIGEGRYTELKDFPLTAQSLGQYTDAELQKGKAYYEGNLVTTPIEKKFRASQEEDVVAVGSIDEVERRRLMTLALNSLAEGKGALSTAAAGASSRMNVADAPDEVKSMVQGREIASKGGVPIGVKDGQVYTFVGAMLKNIARLGEQIAAKVGYPVKPPVVIMTNDQYRGELDSEIADNQGYGVDQDQLVIFHQELGNQYVAKPEDVKALYEKGKIDDARYEAALEISKAAEKSLAEGNLEGLMLEGEVTPLGHGEFLHQMVSSGTLLNLINRGVEWVSVRNIDNSAATFDEDWLVSVGLFLDKGLDMQPEVSPRAPGQKGGSLIVTEDGMHQLAEDPQIAVSDANNLNPDATSYWFNDAVAIMSIDYLTNIYKKEGQSKEDFIDELKTATPEQLEIIAERGRKKFPALLDPKPAKKTDAVSLKVETNMWQSTGVVSPDVKVEGVGVIAVKNIQDTFPTLSPEEQYEVVKSLRMLATKQWEGPVESYESNKQYIDLILKYITEANFFPEDLEIKGQALGVTAGDEVVAQASQALGQEMKEEIADDLKSITSLLLSKVKSGEMKGTMVNTFIEEAVTMYKDVYRSMYQDAIGGELSDPTDQETVRKLGVSGVRAMPAILDVFGKQILAFLSDLRQKGRSDLVIAELLRNSVDVFAATRLTDVRTLSGYFSDALKSEERKLISDERQKSSQSLGQQEYRMDDVLTTLKGEDAIEFMRMTPEEQKVYMESLNLPNVIAIDTIKPISVDELVIQVKGDATYRVTQVSPEALSALEKARADASQVLAGSFISLAIQDNNPTLFEKMWRYLFSVKIKGGEAVEYLEDMAQVRPNGPLAQLSVRSGEIVPSVVFSTSDAASLEGIATQLLLNKGEVAVVVVEGEEGIDRDAFAEFVAAVPALSEPQRNDIFNRVFFVELPPEKSAADMIDMMSDLDESFMLQGSSTTLRDLWKSKVGGKAAGLIDQLTSEHISVTAEQSVIADIRELNPDSKLMFVGIPEDVEDPSAYQFLNYGITSTLAFYGGYENLPDNLKRTLERNGNQLVLTAYALEQYLSQLTTEFEGLQKTLQAA